MIQVKPSAVLDQGAAAAAAKSLQSCPTLCDPIDGSPSGSTAPGILQARTLEWVAISFSNAWKWKVKVKSLSHVRRLVTPWTAAYQGSSIYGIFQARVLVGLPLLSLWTRVAMVKMILNCYIFNIFRKCIVKICLWIVLRVWKGRVNVMFKFLFSVNGNLVFPFI